MTDIIQYLVAHGAYQEAARMAVERQDLRLAIQLYERVWRFADALPLALQLGDRGLAVRLALDASLPDRATEIADATEGATELLAVAEAFAARGRPFEAGRAAERAGDWRRAAALYHRAGAPLDEARVRAEAGELREAGLICERLVAHGSPDEAVRARLELGRLLARLGRFDEAARNLQIAARTPALRPIAQRALCGALLAIGFRGAAREVLARLRQEDSTLPRSPEELVALDAAETATRSELGPLRRLAPSATGAGARRFQIVKLLGGGATGRVYEALDTLLGIPVALKLLVLGGGASDPERQAYLRFAREAEAAGRLRHPNIVALYDAQAASGLFVFELMAGGTLSSRLAAEGPLSPAASRRLALDLLAALGAAHERGIVHRDVKPDNVFFDLAGNAKLGDFGGAHLVDFGQTQTGGFLGTLAYMSPEQITGAPIRFAADLYALGATLFEALTGRPPFLGPDLVGQHLGEPPPPATAIHPGLSPAHDETLRRALAKSPEERFASAVEMAEAVAGWPTEAPAVAVAVQPEPSGAGGAPSAPLAAGSAPPVIEDREIWQTAGVRLVRRRDPRAARDVLVEEHLQPLDDGAVARVRRLAAAGGPFVQRIVRLSDDRRAIWYEAIEGEPQPIGALGDEDHRRLSEAGVTLPLSDARGFIRTDAGPVLLVVSQEYPD